MRPAPSCLRCFLRSADRSAAADRRRVRATSRTVRRLLSRRLAGVRRRPCRAAAVAGRRWCRRAGSATTPSSPAMARRRRCPDRCSPSPPISARSWGRAERLARARLCSRRDLPAVVPAGDRRAAVLGRTCAGAGAQAALRGVNAAVVGLLLAALYNPVWTAASPARTTSRSPSPPFCCCSCGSRRPGWWWC